MTLYRAEWDAITAQAFTPVFNSVAAEHPHLFDYGATFDALLRDPYVDVLVIPSEYMSPSVIVTEGDMQTELPLEVTQLQAPITIDATEPVKVIEQ